MARFSALLLVVVLGVSSPATQAHLLKVFAFAEGNRIDGTTYFVGGIPAAGAGVEVMSEDGRLLTTLVPNSAGEFSYEAKSQTDHVIVANTGDGHVARWTVPASELTGRHTDSADQDALNMLSPVTASAATEPSNGELAILVEQSVARQIRPLREQLIAYEDRIRLRDIIGGVGYILGLFGLAIWWRQRHRSDS
jgi:nickel transport protein